MIMPISKIDPVDQIIADNLRRYRVAAGMTQAELGDALGLSFQQVQKYEKALNRVSASRLFRIAEELKVPVTAFFEEASDGGVG